MPYTWSWLSANSRHSRRTAHPAQIFLARATCRSAGPAEEIGKKRSGSADRQAPAERQFAAFPVALIACPRMGSELVSASVRCPPAHRLHLGRGSFSAPDGAGGLRDGLGGRRLSFLSGGTLVNGPVVTALETAVYVIPTDEPEADGTLTWDKTTMVLVRARAGGEQGLGWSYASAAAQIVITEILADVVTGRDALDTAGLAEAMARQGPKIGRPGVAATAISAVDIALWDLKARLLAQPLAGLL